MAFDDGIPRYDHRHFGNGFGHFGGHLAGKQLAQKMNSSQAELIKMLPEQLLCPSCLVTGFVANYLVTTIEELNDKAKEIVAEGRAVSLMGVEKLEAMLENGCAAGEIPAEAEKAARLLDEFRELFEREMEMVLRTTISLMAKQAIAELDDTADDDGPSAA